MGLTLCYFQHLDGQESQVFVLLNSKPKPSALKIKEIFTMDFKTLGKFDTAAVTLGIDEVPAPDPKAAGMTLSLPTALRLPGPWVEAVRSLLMGARCH